MEKLNKKSVVFCDETEYEYHQKENDEIINKLFMLENYKCAVLHKFIDLVNKDTKLKIISSKLHDIYDVIEMCDCKNGFDCYLDDENNLVLFIYGQQYEYDNKNCMVTTMLKIMPYNEVEEFISLSHIFAN